MLDARQLMNWLSVVRNVTGRSATLRGMNSQLKVDSTVLGIPVDVSQQTITVGAGINAQTRKRPTRAQAAQCTLCFLRNHMS
jgi:hypothetical protein